MESELAQAQQAEAEARKGRQAAEANSEQLREESEQLLERANWWRTVVAAMTALGTAAGIMFGVLDLWPKRPETIANNAAIIANNAAIELANNAAIEQV